MHGIRCQQYYIILNRIIKNRLRLSPIDTDAYNRSTYYRVQRPICAWAHGSSPPGMKGRCAPELKNQSMPELKCLHLSSRVDLRLGLRVDLRMGSRVDMRLESRVNLFLGSRVCIRVQINLQYASNIKIHTELFQRYRHFSSRVNMCLGSRVDLSLGSRVDLSLGSRVDLRLDSRVNLFLGSRSADQPSICFKYQDTY